MAAGAQELKVRVGLLFDEKSLANMERSLRSSGQRLSRIGTDLSLSLSLPLATFGVTAIKAAGDIESLTLALKSQLGTADAAAKEFDKLTESAKKPGIGLEQAVRGSVRLQAVALSADQARGVIEEMGNAIAATGGTAAELDAVTRQFSQMISKGRVLQEDVTILSENMPAIAGLMQKAFGTQSVEAIRNMGVSGKDFVLAITDAAKGLDRVESGIKNGIGNAMDSLKQSAAKVGFAINEAFDVTGAIENVSAAVLAVAQAFAGLPDGVKDVALGFIALMIAVGPVMKAWGTLQLLSSAAVGAWKGVVKGITAVDTAFGKLNSSMQSFILIGIVVAVIAIMEAYSAYSNVLSDTEQAQRAVADVQKQATASVEGERAKISNLVAVLEDNTRSLKEKKGALNELQKISPQYFGNLDIEKGKVIGLTAATDAYIRSLEKQATVKLATDEIAKLSDQLRNLGDQGAVSNLDKFGNAVKTLGINLLGGGLLATQTAKTFDNLNESTQKFNQIDFQQTTQTKIDALRKLVSENIELGTSTEDTTKKIVKSGAAMGEASKIAKVLKEVLSDVANAGGIANAIGDDADIATIKALETGVRKLVDAGFKPASAEVQNLKAQLDALKGSVVGIDIIRKPAKDDFGNNIPIAPVTVPAPIDPAGPGLVSETTRQLGLYSEAAAIAAEATASLNAKTFEFQTGLDTIAQKLFEAGDIMGTVFAAMGSSIAKSAADGATSFAQLGQAAVGAAAKIIRAYIQQGVAAAVAKALGSLPFPLNIAAGAAAGGIAAALFTKAIGAIGVKGFARGTSYAPGGTALVGEQGPELINLPRGSQVFPTPQTNQMLSGMGGGSVNVGGEFTIKGTDLVVVLERAQRQKNRFS